MVASNNHDVLGAWFITGIMLIKEDFNYSLRQGNQMS